MSMTLLPELIRDIADRLLRAGKQPTPAAVCEQLGGAANGVTNDTVEEELRRWWADLPERLVLNPEAMAEAPDAMARAVKVLWQDAVKEAVKQVSLEHRSLDSSIEAIRQESEDLLVSSRADYDTLETRYRREMARAEEAENEVKVLAAEISVLKSNLASELAERNQVEEKLHDARQEIKRAAKTLEDVRRTFDNRLKDEQAHNQELLSKAEGELRHYRASLEVVRDEAGKKESALTKHIHDLQSEVAKREVKVETLQGQIKSLETELKTMRMDTGDQARKLSQANSRLLTETNKNKRHEERIKLLEAELKQEQQRLSQHSSDAMRKESEWRQTVKLRDDEILKLKAGLNSSEKKHLALEQQIRRLQAQARA